MATIKQRSFTDGLKAYKQTRTDIYRENYDRIFKNNKIENSQGKNETVDINK
jgi:hypothetical protein